MAVMGLGLQRHLLAKYLERRGIDPHSVDLEALLDATLTLAENRSVLDGHLQLPDGNRWKEWAQQEMDEGETMVAVPEPAVAPIPEAGTFGAFVAAPEARPASNERAAYAGLSPAVAGDCMLKAMRELRDVRDVTARQKSIVLTVILRDLAQRGLDVANLTPADVVLYREFLASRVKAKKFATTSASHRAKVWNSSMRLVFGDDALTMRGFAEKPRLIDHVTEEQFARMLDAAAQDERFGDEHDRRLMIAYLHLEWCTGGRIGSLAEGRLEVRDFDFDEGLVKFRHMKNVPEHSPILSPTAIIEMQAWIGVLQAAAVWRGPNTPFFVHADGRVMKNAWLNRHLEDITKQAGIKQHITSHAMRKSVGTILAKINPKFAALQLGISWAVFNNHYNQMTLKDRQDLRHILPGIGRPSGEPHP